MYLNKQILLTLSLKRYNIIFELKKIYYLYVELFDNPNDSVR